MTFENYLKDRVTFNEFRVLHDTIGITRTRFTQILNDPARMTKDEIEIIVRLLAISPTELIEMGCGKRIITLLECEQLQELKGV